MDRVGLLAPYARGQRAQQIGTPSRQVWKTIALDRLGAEVEQFPGVAGLPVPHLLAVGLATERLQWREHAEQAESAGAVRAQLHASADLGQLRRLLPDVDIEPALQQRQRRRQPADAGAGDQHMRFPGHSRILPPSRGAIWWPEIASLRSQ